MLREGCNSACTDQRCYLSPTLICVRPPVHPTSHGLCRCGTYHWQTTWPAKNCSYPVGHKSVHECTALPVDWGSTFHEFAVEHTQDYLAFVVDNKVLVNVSKDDTQAPLFWDMPFFLILNTAIGGSGTWAKPPNSNTYWPTYHRIDYVRGSVRSSG